MTASELREGLNGKKIQDSANPKELSDALTSVGVKVEKESSFYIISEGSATPVDAVIFKAASNEEILAEDLYKVIKEDLITYEEGDLLTAHSSSGNKYTFIFLGEVNDFLLGLGMGPKGLSKKPLKYTKKLTRHATVSEIANFSKLCEQHELFLRIKDRRVDLFSLRKLGQSYFCIKLDFRNQEYRVTEYKEYHDDFDTEMYISGNYFKTRSEALKSVKNLKVEDAVQD